jgi:hypothetical protein
MRGNMRTGKSDHYAGDACRFRKRQQAEASAEEAKIFDFARRGETGPKLDHGRGTHALWKESLLNNLLC